MFDLKKYIRKINQSSSDVSFKVGDVIRIKQLKDIDTKNKYVNFISDMEKYCGRTAIVRTISSTKNSTKNSHKRVRLSSNSWSWDSSWLEEIDF